MLSCSLIYLVSQAVIGAILHPLGAVNVIRAQTTLSAETWLSFARAWESAGLLYRYRAHFLVDFIHPLWYALALAAAIAWGLQRNGAPAAWDRSLLLPVVAAVMDVVENVCHLVFLSDLDAVSRSLVVVSATASNTKWVLAAASVVLASVLALRARRN